MTAAILEISFDGPHAEPATQLHRFGDLGSAHHCERIAQRMEEAKREGRSHYTIRDSRGAEVATLPLHRVTGVRVFRPDLDRALPDIDHFDHKTAAAGG